MRICSSLQGANALYYVTRGKLTKLLLFKQQKKNIGKGSKLAAVRSVTNDSVSRRNITPYLLIYNFFRPLDFSLIFPRLLPLIMTWVKMSKIRISSLALKLL